MSAPAPNFLNIANELAQSGGFVNVSFTAPGAFKETFRAERSDGVQIALKILDPLKCRLERVDREIDAMKRCDSPRIARLYDHGEFIASDGNKYLFVIEEFLDGGTLTSRMTAPIDPDIVRNYALCLCDALDHLAGLKLVHRDIKPDNIMFRQGADEPVLVDFGLVRDLSASSLTMTWVSQGPGSPYFSSPEQLNNDKPLIQWRSDQFSLGLVLGLCLTGEHPFTESGMTIPDTVARMSARQKCTVEFVDRVSTLGFANIPKMLDPYPIGRFATPQELIDSFNL
jgi:serine/threonine protein kinase